MSRTSSRGNNSRRRAARTPLLAHRQIRDAIALLMIAAGVYFSVLLYTGVDGGAFGRGAIDVAHVFVGQATNILPLISLAVGLLLIIRSDVLDPAPFRAGLMLLVPSVLLACANQDFTLTGGTDHDVIFSQTYLEAHGGFLGGAIYYVAYQLFGDVGTSIIIIVGIMLSVVFLTGSSILAITRWWALRIGAAASTGVQTSRELATRLGEATAEPLAAARELLVNESTRAMPPSLDSATTFPDLFGDIPSQYVHALDSQGSGSIEQEISRETPATTQEIDVVEVTVDPEAAATPIPQRTKRTKKANDDSDQLALLQPDGAHASAGETIADTVLRARITDRYSLPDPALLSKSTVTNDINPKDVERTKKLLVETFGHFGIESQIVGMVPGPRVSRYELSLAPGTKMSKVENLRKDLAYALATTEIRILAPIPGKSAVGIEVENAKPAVVTLGDIWKTKPKGTSPLHVWFGKDISGAVVGADLTKMPHMLVAGTTGAGKSGCMNVILSSIILGASPDEVRMLLIDPKKVELSSYEGIPHLLTPVVTNMKKAANALGNVISQMEERYSSMEIAGARTLDEYNKVRIGRGQDPVPIILIVIDELADLVMQAKADVEDCVIRVAQKGRAAGFHLVLATQRPSVDVITGMIKSNVPSRIAFAVSSQTDSRVILDQNGAETLLGSGDMLFKPVWARTVQRVQGAWISEPEVRAICDASRQERAPEYDIDLLSEPEAAPGAGELGAVDEDDRLNEAIRLIAEFQTCSASFFQRRMRVGYTRGARLVDMLERRGLVAPGEGPRPRTVLITADDLPRIFATDNNEEPEELAVATQQSDEG